MVLKTSKINKIVHAWHRTFHRFSAFLESLFSDIFTSVWRIFFIKINQNLTIMKVEIFCFSNTNIAREIIGKYSFQNTEKPWKVICQTYTIFPILEIFEIVIFGGISLKGLNPASHYRSTGVVSFFCWWSSKRILLKITDVFWFLETFSPLITFVAKSLFKTRKISDLQGFFGDHPKKNVNSVISILIS